MGSYNLTCGVSQLAITPGDRVRLVLITQGPYGYGAEGFCYANEAWFPRCFLAGKYADYGDIEEVEEGPLTDLIVRGFQKDKIAFNPENAEKPLDLDNLLGLALHGSLMIRSGYSMREGSRGGQVARRTKVYTLEDFQEHPSQSETVEALEARVRFHNESQERNRWEAITNHAPGDVLRVGAFWVLEDIYRAVIQNGDDEYGEALRGRYWLGAEAYLDDLPKRAKSFKRTLEDTEWLTKMREKLPDYDGFPDLRAEWNNYFYLAMDKMGPAFEVAFEQYDRMLVEMVMGGLDARGPEVMEVVGELVDFFTFNHALSRMRKAYYPQAGLGSQGDDRRAHRALARTVLAYLDRQDREDKEADELKGNAWRKRRDAEEQERDDAWEKWRTGMVRGLQASVAQDRAKRTEKDAKEQAEFEEFFKQFEQKREKKPNE